MTTILRDRHIAPCPDCDGGEVIHNDTNPHGCGPDPQREVAEQCTTCHGAGEVETWVDPLIAMQRAKWNRANGWYDIFRMRAMRAVSGLAQAEMLAMATRCVTATERMRQSYERWAA